MDNRFTELLADISAYSAGNQGRRPAVMDYRRSRSFQSNTPSMPVLSWPGATTEQRNFMQAVYQVNYNRYSRNGTRAPHPTVPAAQLSSIGGRFQLLTAAANDFLAMKAAADQAIATAGVNVVMGVTSAYRSAAHQLRIWQRNFPHYYNETQQNRRGLSGGEHGSAAAAYLGRFIRGKVSTPGFSNHNQGLAVDIKNTENGTVLRNSTARAAVTAWKATWLWGWLVANAATYNFYQDPDIDEPWHWVHQPGRGAAMPTGGTSTAKSLMRHAENPRAMAQLLVNTMSFAGVRALVEELHRCTGRQPGHSQGMNVTMPPPSIVNRAGWGAAGFKGTPVPLGTVTNIVVHHTAGSNDASTTAPATIRSIQSDHQNRRGFSDIGYHFLIDRDGQLYQGRPFLNGTDFAAGPDLSMGAHVARQNTGKIGIVLMGCFNPTGCSTTHTVSAAALNTLTETCIYLCLLNNIRGAAIQGHRDFKPTACPGDALYGEITALRTRVDARLP